MACLFLVSIFHFYCQFPDDWFWALNTHPWISVRHWWKINPSLVNFSFCYGLEPEHSGGTREIFDEEKVSSINSKISVLDYFGIPLATYLTYSDRKKSRMLSYQKLVNKYFSLGEINCLTRLAIFFWCFLHSVAWHFIGLILLVNEDRSKQIDHEPSSWSFDDYIFIFTS